MKKYIPKPINASKVVLRHDLLDLRSALPKIPMKFEQGREFPMAELGDRKEMIRQRSILA